MKEERDVRAGAAAGYFGDVSDWDDLTGGAASMELRRKCLEEEWIELQEALDEDDLPQIAKEVADVVWTALAIAKGFGVPFDAVWEAVRRSNFDKVGPNGEMSRRGDGKIIKPPGWKPPDIIRILEEVPAP